MNDKKRKIIMIVLVIIFLVAIIGVSAVMLLKPKKEAPVVVYEDIYKLPTHTVYYINDDIYMEGVNPDTVNKDIKVDFTEYYVKDNLKSNVNIEFKSDITSLQQDKGIIYGLYEKAVVTLNKTNKIRKITPESKEVLAYKISGNNMVRYVKEKDKYSLEIEDMYTKTVRNLSSEQVNSFDVDKDGIYVVYSEGENKNQIVRYMWETFNKVVIETEVAEKIVKIDDWIYYLNKSQGDKIYRVYKDGTRKNMITKEKFSIPEMSKNKFSATDYLSGYLDTIYYINTEDKNRLFVYKVQEDQKQIISNDSVEHFKIVGDFIYYSKTNEDGLYVMHKDGSYVNKILDKKPADYIVFETKATL